VARRFPQRLSQRRPQCAADRLQSPEARFRRKHFLGTTIKGRGIDEIATAIAILSVEPPTAHYISTQLAQYFCCDQPSDDLVRTMAATWRKSDGDIAQVLDVLFSSHEFAQSLGKKFKDPIHYAVSAVRVTYGNQVIVSAQPMLNWLSRMGGLPSRSDRARVASSSPTIRPRRHHRTSRHRSCSRAPITPR
jgi:hypothetical protein